jgi:membrane protease YdiL (CAAX protease family)
LLIVSLVSLQGVAFPAVAAGYFTLRERSLLAFLPIAVPSAREVGIILAGWVGTFLLVGVGASVVTALAGSPPAENTAGQTAIENPEFIPVLIVLVFLLNAPGEELLFRGVIQGLLRERFGPVAAILLATATFAPIHIFALVGSLQAALVTITILAIPSIVFGTVYELTDNLVVPTLVHGLFNATLFGGLYVVATAG